MAELRPEPFAAAEKLPRVRQERGDIGPDATDNRLTVGEEPVQAGLDGFGQASAFGHAPSLSALGADTLGEPGRTTRWAAIREEAAVPLSEHEQRLLDEMERQLYQNDADFVSAVGRPRRHPTYRTVLLGVLLLLVGIAVLVAGVISKFSIVGIIGFVLMFAGVVVALTPKRKPNQTPPDDRI